MVSALLLIGCNGGCDCDTAPTATLADVASAYCTRSHDCDPSGVLTHDECVTGYLHLASLTGDKVGPSDQLATCVQTIEDAECKALSSLCAYVVP